VQGVKSDNCGVCGRSKRKYPSGRTRCLHCERRQRREWRQNNLEEARRIGREQQAQRRERIGTEQNRAEQWNWMLIREYGINADEYKSMLEWQEGRCAICRSDEPHHASGRFVVDHDHNSGCVRGLLCGWCNSALGYVRDRPTIAQQLVDYLKKEKEVGNAHSGRCGGDTFVR